MDVDRPPLGQVVRLSDAVFYDVEVEESSIAVGAQPDFPSAGLILSATSQACKTLRVASSHCIIVSLAAPEQHYICAPPPDAEGSVASFSPIFVFDVVLMRMNPPPSQTPPQSVAECRARAIVPEWSFVQRPLLRRTLSDAPPASFSPYAEFDKLVTIDWMRQRYVMTHEGDELAINPAFSYVAAGLDIDAENDNGARFMLTRYLAPRAASAVAATSAPVTAGLRRLLAVAPWQLFAEGTIDSTALGAALAEGGPSLARRNYDSTTWHAIASAYARIQALYARHGIAALPLDRSAPLVRVMCELDLLAPGAPEGTLVLSVVPRSAERLVDFVRWAQGTRAPAAIALPGTDLFLLGALRTRDILFVEIDLPCAARVQGVAPPRLLHLEMAAVVLEPTLQPTALADVRARLLDGVTARLPLVIVEDLQLWEPHQLWFWLCALLCTPLPSSSGNGGGLPFKLLFTYNALCDDVGARDLLLLGAADEAHRVACTGFGFPGPMLGKCPDTPKGSLLYYLVQNRDEALLDGNAYASKLLSYHAAGLAAGDLPTAQARRAQLDASVPVVDSASPVSALQQLRVQEWSLGAPPASVAITQPLDMHKFATLACLCSRVILIIE